MSTVVYQAGQCSVHGGYDHAACVQVDGKLVCCLCLMKRINDEAPEIIRMVHSRPAHDHTNRSRAISWEVRPGNGCSRCDEAIFESWLEVFVPHTVG